MVSRKSMSNPTILTPHPNHRRPSKEFLRMIGKMIRPELVVFLSDTVHHDRKDINDF